jgi:SAM-dependent methyltransferase
VVDPTHFNKLAEVYERFRPPYPDALWQRLGDLGVLRAGVRVLELGAGTGEATGRLVESGATVTAVEPGPALAERLHRRVPAARILIATAEDAVVPDAAFDIVVVATAVHWLDLDIVVPKLHHALAPGGRLVVWRNVFGDPDVHTRFRERVADIVARRGWPQRPTGLEKAEWIRRLMATYHFAESHTDVFRWSVDLDADQIRGLFTTFSDWSAEEAEAAAQAVDDLGGRVTEHYLTPLIVLTRIDLPHRSGIEKRGPASRN